MNNVVFLGNERIRLDPSLALGKGGEADVYRLGGKGGSNAPRALKIWKEPDHADFQGDPIAQAAAEKRIQTHQTKMRQFPQHLPAHVIAPMELALDKQGLIVGYCMPLVGGCEALYRFSTPVFRKSGGIPNSAIIPSLLDLYRTLRELHQRQVVVGDFNDLNVLTDVKAGNSYIIDADSFQFGQFLCQVFTERFVDPLLCDQSLTSPMLVRPFSTNSDIYAFVVMLFQSLLCVSPFGGIYKPKDKSKRMPEGQRPLKRITVFHPEVQYPKPATPFKILPVDLLHFFDEVFAKDKRGEFPVRLIDNLRWTACSSCGIEHACQVCPFCATQAPASAIVETVRGNVTMRKIFHSAGVILCAELHNNNLTWLYHEAGQLKREDGSVLAPMPLDTLMRYRLRGDATVLAKNGRLVTIKKGQPPQPVSVDNAPPNNRAAFDTNGHNTYWLSSGTLYKEGQLGQERIGDGLVGQTMVWVGEKFGFGMYRAGQVTRAFVFDAVTNTGINDSVQLPRLKGNLLAAKCYFGREYAWFAFTMEEGGKMVNRMLLVRSTGQVEASAEAQYGDGSWLSNIGGSCANESNNSGIVSPSLFVPTDDGIVRVEPQGGILVETKRFPDTAPYCDDNSRLVLGSGGLYVVGTHDIVHLTIR